jgi:amino acid permease
VLSAFFVTLGETGSETLESFLPARLSGVWWARPLFVKAAFAAAPLLPLALQRNLSALAAASTLVVVAIMYLVGVVIIMGSGDCPTTDDDGGGGDDDCADDESGGGVSAVRFGPDFFSAVPIAVLAFGNQVNVHQVVRELNEPTPARRAQVILCTNGLVTAVYAAIGVAGCELFRNQREFLKKDGNALLCLRQFLCLLPFHFSVYQS